MAKTKQTFKVTNVKDSPWGYKYNVQVLYDGWYAGIGKFCKTKSEVDKYIKSVKKEKKGEIL